MVFDSLEVQPCNLSHYGTPLDRPVKVGDCVRVLCDPFEIKWTGICVWTDGYKFEFLIDGQLEVWDKHDLKVIDAKVISEDR